MIHLLLGVPIIIGFMVHVGLQYLATEYDNYVVQRNARLNRYFECPGVYVTPRPKENTEHA
jgi:hypothetical protein